MKTTGKSYYPGLVIKIFLLTAGVCGIFLLLGIVGYDFLGFREKISGGAPQNILITLLENYEKMLREGRAGLVGERDIIAEKLDAVTARVERSRIASELRVLESKIREFDVFLERVAVEKTAVARGEMSDTSLASRIEAEKNRLRDELLEVKLYWNTYTGGIRSALIAGETDTREDEEITRAFEKDDGLAYVTDITSAYYKGRQGQATDGAGSSTRASGAGDTAELDIARAEIEKLTARIKELEATITGKDSDIKDMVAQIEILLDQSNINGYFVSRNGQAFLVLNRKKEAEILSTGTFTVYDKNRNAVSKIYVSRQAGRITFTKLPGYANPMPGNWF